MISAQSIIQFIANKPLDEVFMPNTLTIGSMRYTYEISPNIVKLPLASPVSG